MKLYAALLSRLHGLYRVRSYVAKMSGAKTIRVRISGRPFIAWCLSHSDYSDHIVSDLWKFDII